MALQEWSHSTLDLNFVRPQAPGETPEPETEPTGEGLVVPGPDLRFRLAQVTPVMGPTSGGRWVALRHVL